MQEEQYIKRDVSWLAFNERVLQEAQDERVPLYERIKFLAIYSSNLDEFFRVRVASLRSFRKLKKKTRQALEIKPKRELREIQDAVAQQQQAFGHTFREEILPALQTKGIHLLEEEVFNETQRAFAREYFVEKMQALLKPTFLADGDEAPFLENAGLYFVVQFSDSDQLAIINIPSDQLPRFIELPSADDAHYLTFLDDILRSNLELFFEKPIKAAFAIKLSRDAELDIEDEFTGDLIDKIKKSLKKRKVGLPTRFLYDNAMPEDLLLRLKHLFQLSKDDIMPGARYHNFNDFFGFPNPLNDGNLHDIPLPPLPHLAFEKATSLLAVIAKQDYLLHFPYQKYDYVIQLIQEAANDAAVTSIKITLYRIAGKSAVVEALLKACEQGKQVTVFVEAKARFDEENNLQWGARLEAAGAKVHYSQPGIKVHSKLLLITQEAEAELKHYAYIGTGNFNEKTALLYTDHALLTSDERLGEEVAQVFDYLENGKEPNPHHLLVSPFTLRSRFLDKIDREIANAKKGNPAYMRIKMNSLEDKRMIDKLYEASAAGVQIQLIVRGICSLVAGVKDLSENIEMISIVDRFLEHARIYLFANGGEEELYIASADWMTRNLDHRVEVATPIYNPQLFKELKDILNIQWQDNVKARYLQSEQMNVHKPASDGEKTIQAQQEIYQFLAQKSAS